MNRRSVCKSGMFSTALKSVSAAALIAACTAPLLAQAGGYIHAESHGRIDKGPTSGVRAGGSWWIHADAWDSDTGWGTPGHASGAYGTAPEHHGPVTSVASGPLLRASSKAEMNTFTRRRFGFLWRLVDGWDMGESFATVTGRANPADETAFANAMTLDPNFYEVLPGDDSTQFCIAFEAGLSIAAFSDPDVPASSASASITGFMDTDHWLDPMTTEPVGRLFTYAWSTSSGDPSSSRFSFISHPALGLDDAAIMDEFMSAVEFDPLNGLALATDVVIWSAPIPASPGYIYEVGGETHYHAEAAVPAPGALTLLALAGLIATRRQHG